MAEFRQPILMKLVEHQILSGKNGLTRLIRMTQSKVRAFQKSQKSSKTPDFQSV